MDEERGEYWSDEAKRDLTTDTPVTLFRVLMFLI
jgi:hypothetical protein